MSRIGNRMGIGALRSLFWLLFFAIAAYAGEVSYKMTEFDSLLKFRYFEDTRNMIGLDDNHIVWSSYDEGRTWRQQTTIPPTEARYMIPHAFDESRLILAGSNKKHWKTSDSGKTYVSFTTPLEPAFNSLDLALSFHVDKPAWLLFVGKKCDVTPCVNELHFSDDFGSTWFRLGGGSLIVESCIFGRSSKKFVSNTDAIFCTTPPKRNQDGMWYSDLIMSTDNFGTHKTVFSQMSNFIIIDKVLLVAVVSDDEDIDLHVSLDGVTFAEAKFPPGVDKSLTGYLLLEPGSAAVILDVIDESGKWGTVIGSNSNGTYYHVLLHNINHNNGHHVDFERMYSMEGVLVANQIVNVGKSDQYIQTLISYNDGGSWHNIPAPAGSCIGCSLHLHSWTEDHLDDIERSSSGAPGLMMGIGNIGKKLEPYETGDTYLTRDGGLTWKMVRKGPHLYEIGDQGAVIVIVNDKDDTHHFRYSLDEGETWDQVSWHDGVEKMDVLYLETEPSDTSRQFFIFGEWHKKDGSVGFAGVHIDFSNLLDRQCTENDFEDWVPHFNQNDCFLGHKAHYKRRISGRQCYIGKAYEDPVIELEHCPCDEEDFECDFNFDRDSQGNCVLAGPLAPQPPVCPVGTTYLTSSGYQLIPGDTCEGGLRLDTPIEKPCTASGGTSPTTAPPTTSPTTAPPTTSPTTTPTSPPNDDRVVAHTTIFTNDILNIYYLNKDENVVLLDASNTVWASLNKGATWTKLIDPFTTIPIASIVVHPYDNNAAFFLAKNPGTQNFATWDGGKTVVPFGNSLRPAIGLRSISFNRDDPSFLIYHGWEDNHILASISINKGKTWKPLETYVSQCVFGRDKMFAETNEDAIYCLIHDTKIGDQATLTPIYSLVKTDDYFVTREIIETNVVGFLVFRNFMAIVKVEKNKTKFMISSDGTEFSSVRLPPDVPETIYSYHLFQSSSNSLFVDLWSSINTGDEMGLLLFSDSSGLQYSTSMRFTNRNERNDVDFVKVEALEGIYLANQVQNPDDVLYAGSDKNIATFVTYDEGSTWTKLTPPATDYSGNLYDCGSDCSLHIHGSTNRAQPGLLHSVPSAPGLLMGVGNVGSKLLAYDEGNTYLSRDAGRTWKEVRRGAHLYEFADHGAITVIVNDEDPTNHIRYSWNEGETWINYDFSQDKIRVEWLTTDPDSTSQTVIVIGNRKNANGKTETVLVHIDFSGIHERECEISDFESWSPHSDDSDCLLGRQISYYRRKQYSECAINNSDVNPIITSNCQCTFSDFECDYNYERNPATGKCEIIHPSLEEPNDCKPGESYIGPSGYRKIAGDSCINGIDLSKPKSKPCTLEHSFIRAYKNSFNYIIRDMEYFQDSSVILMLLNDGNLWISLDEGGNWNQSSVVKSAVDIILSPYDRQVGVVLGNSKTHYITNNGGRTFTAFDTPIGRNVKDEEIRFHETSRSHLIFHGSVGCPGSTCHKEAYYSENFGKSWVRLASYVEKCEWASGGNFDKELVFCTEYLVKSGEQGKNKGDKLVLRRYNTVKSISPEVVDENVLGFHFVDGYLTIGVVGSQQGTADLVVSTDGYDFSVAVLPPFLTIKAKAYAILQSNLNSLMIAVFNFITPGRGVGTLLKSNSEGHVFSLSTSNLNLESPYVDFERIQGMDGIIIANLVDNAQAVTTDGAIKQIRTYISFNDGGDWKLVKAPELDANYKPLNCDLKNGCSLHLHGPVDQAQVGFVFSTSGSTGLFAAVGNTGRYLTPYNDGDTYVTRDGGINWFQVKKGAHLYEFGDMGAILVLVDNEEPTNKLWYSWNEGKNWESFQFNLDPIRVTTLTTEAESTTQSFLLIGTEVSDKSNTAIVTFKIDFTNLHDRKCTESDFEYWTPFNVGNGNCILGRKKSYQRRKQDAKCYVGKKFADVQTLEEHCPCTEDDFECEVVFMRDEKDECVPITGVWPQPDGCKVGETYTATSGYRRVPSDTCVGGINLAAPIQRTCQPKQQPVGPTQPVDTPHPTEEPSSEGKTSGGVIAAFILVPIVVVTFITVAFIYYRKFRDGSVRLPRMFRNYKYSRVDGMSDADMLMDDY